MNRRELLKSAIPIAALAPVAVAEGIARFNLEPSGHFLFIVNVEQVDVQHLLDAGNEQVPLLPKGSKGGWIISVYGDVNDAIKIFRLDDKNAGVVESLMGRPPDIKA